MDVLFYGHSRPKGIYRSSRARNGYHRYGSNSYTVPRGYETIYHSMAVLMSRRLQDKDSADSTLAPSMTKFLQQLIQTQEEEIRWMKERV